MPQPSILQSLGGPLGGQKFEFRGGNATIGSAPDCAVRLEAPGVEGYHARIVVDITGATIFRVDGSVGVNDDVVTTDSLLRSGDFVWIGEPGGPASLMFQFTLGDVEEAEAEQPPAAAAAASEAAIETAPAEEIGPDDLPSPEPVPVDEAPAAAAAEDEPVEHEQFEEPVVHEQVEEPVEHAQFEAPIEQAQFEEPAVQAPMESPVEQEMMEPAPEPPLEQAEPAEEDSSQPQPALEEAMEPAAATAAEPMTLETADEPVLAEPAAEPEAPVALEAVTEIEHVTEVEHMTEVEHVTEIEPVTELEPVFEPPPAFSQTAEVEPTLVESAEVNEGSLPGPSAPVAETVLIPPAPWQMPSAPVVEQAPAAEYASAWESPPPAAAAPPAEAPAPAPVAPPPAPPAAAQTRAPRPATTTGAAKRPAPAQGIKIRTVEQDKALRTPPPPPPPARTTSSMPIIIGGLVVLLVVAIGGFFALRTPAPAPPPPTPVPTPVVVATPEATPVATPEPTQVAAVEAAPTPEPTAVPVAPPPPTPRPTATPAPRATPTPAPRATPTPRTTPTPARPGAPLPAPTAAAPAAPVSQAPRLLEEARTAMNAKDLSRAGQLLGEVLKIEPGNAEAATRKAEVDARLFSLGRKFATGATSVTGGKTAKGPSGFDLGGGGVVKTDFSAQIRCTTTPTAVDPGTAYSIRCSILNIGAKSFKIDGITANEVADGARATGAGVAPRGDIAPQADAVILERTGTWSAKSGWSLEIVAKTSKDESFRAVYNWR